MHADLGEGVFLTAELRPPAVDVVREALAADGAEAVLLREAIDLDYYVRHEKLKS
jgi:hypothetical protein